MTIEHAPSPHTRGPIDSGDTLTRLTDSTAQRRREISAAAAWFRRSDRIVLSTATAQFTIGTAVHDGLTVITAAGDIDMQTVPVLSRELAMLDPTAMRVIIDLTAVSFLSCAGMAALLHAHDAISPTGQVAIVASRAATRILALAGLTDTLNVHATLRSAVVALTGR
ncbi:STAS domain-containing protein [Williamsia soli]|uniref:STAS domain-containing protein n=1 Tax=Williamsia soli TaxID=364929 RepID=UPI001A9DBC56|nr:STAS domain-containing protein [Williamsia soli]